MVRNTTGGTGHKSQASKFQDKSKQSSAKTRFVKEDGELYAYVAKNLGNGMCHVMCQDNTTRLCIIRGKFRGRGKKDNIISNGKWILIGIRDYESVKEGKLENCDLLEVYSDIDKERLKSQVSNVDWRKFIENDCAITHVSKSDAKNFEFSDQRMEDYTTIMEQGDANPIQLTIREHGTEEEEEDAVDIDDI
jgi:initiation factor 1A